MSYDAVQADGPGASGASQEDEPFPLLRGSKPPWAEHEDTQSQGGLG